MKAKYNLYEKELTYRIYLTETMYYYGENKRLSARFIDIINPKPVDTRTGDEIAIDVIQRLGLKV